MPEQTLRRAVAGAEFAVGHDLTLRPDGREEALVLNHTAAAIWRALERPLTLTALVDELAATFGQDPTAIRADVTAGVETLVALDVVRFGPA